MPVNKVIYNDSTLIDVTSVDTEPEDVTYGKTFMDRSGTLRSGSAIRTAIYDVTLDNMGAVIYQDPNLTYQTVSTAMSSGKITVLLHVTVGTIEIYVPAMEVLDTTNGPIKFVGEFIASDTLLRSIELTLSTQDVLTSGQRQVEIWAYKVQDVIANRTNTLTYPSTKAVYDQFQRKPVEIWRAADASSMLKGIQANLAANPAWQLTGLDLTPYKRIKVHAKCGQSTGTTASSGTTAAMVLEILLDPFAAIAAYGGNYCGSIVSQKPNNDNRIATLTCAVSADKTKFVVLRQTNLYGTAGTNNNDVNADVFMIEGYYD